MSPHEHHGVAHPVPGAITNDSLQTGDRSTPSPVGAGAWAGLWNALTGLIATVAGIAPHVLHHVGLFAGAFLITGAAPGTCCSARSDCSSPSRCCVGSTAGSEHGRRPRSPSASSR